MARRYPVVLLHWQTMLFTMLPIRETHNDKHHPLDGCIALVILIGCQRGKENYMGRDRFEARCDKRNAIKQAEQDGTIADSMEVRMALLKRVETGEMTLAECQAELARIKKNAKKDGKLTRDQVWRQG